MNERLHSTSVGTHLARLGVTVLERGWLSSNNVLFQGVESTAMVDSGYCTHSQQTVALVQNVLQARPLDLLLNTHLHSDHCGGNAALQLAYPQLTTMIPPGQAAAVANWDPVALTYQPTGQTCPRFNHQDVLAPGSSVRLGDSDWQIHAAKGHDPHSIVLFEPASRILISADALWENGFGVIFPELEGIDAFKEVADTLSLIETLDPAAVIPGHGCVFEDVRGALKRAHSRLEQFARNPEKHRRYALKVLVKFKLLEWKTVRFNDLLDWYAKTPYIVNIKEHQTPPDLQSMRMSLHSLIDDLIRSHALRVDGDWVIDT